MFSADHVRPVERQQVLAAEPVEVDVADAVAAAEHRLAVDRERHAEARREVVAIGIDQRALVDRAVLRLDQRVRVGIEVGEEVVLLPLRRGELIAQPEVQRQPVGRPEVVLQIREVHPLAEVGDERVDDRVAVAQPEHEVGEVVGRRVGCRRRRAAELPAVGVAPVLRIEVVDLRVDRLVLVAGLEALTAANPRVVDARIEHRRILELRIAVLPAPRRPAGDALLGQAAREPRIGREAGDAVEIEHRRAADAGRLLAGLGARDAEPDIQQRGRRHGEGEAGHALLVLHVHEGVARAARSRRESAAARSCRGCGSCSARTWSAAS